MPRTSRPRPLLQAWLAGAALLLQLVAPAVHPLHGPVAAAHDSSATCSAPSAAAHQVAAHDALSCVFCGAAAQARAGALGIAAAPLFLPASVDVVIPARSGLIAAPSLTRAAPRAPPALA